MRKIKEVLRLYFMRRSQREIARSVRCSHSAVGEYIRRAKLAGFANWERVSALHEDELDAQLFARIPGPGIERPLPNWQLIHEELRRPGVTLELLWQEYKSQHPDGYGRSRFNGLYREWTAKLSMVMRQIHKAGEKAFIDYCDGLYLTDRQTGERTLTQLFVAALGASSYTFAEATVSQALPQWLQSHAHAYEFFNGVPRLTIPDNLKSGVTKPDRYEPDINPAYQELAIHYNTCVMPARVRKPRDKAKVEAAVLVAQRWILARLRDRVFYTMEDMNRCIRILLGELNDRVMRHRGKSRRELYETTDRPALGPLPATPYEFSEIVKCRVNIDYHVKIKDNFYSVPYALVHQVVEIRQSVQTVEILHKGRRIASHVCSGGMGNYTTSPQHMPAAHRAYAEWTPTRIQSEASSIGPNTNLVVEQMLERKAHVELAYRSALGVIRLARTHGTGRLELAAAKAVALESVSYQTIKSILERRTESIAMEANSRPEPEINLAPENIRGSSYYS